METEAATPSNSTSTFAPGSIRLKAPIPRGHLISRVKASITVGLAGFVIGVLGASSADASIPRDASRSTFTLGAASDTFATAPQLKLPPFTEELKAIDARVAAASECVALCELVAGIEAHPFGRAELVIPFGTQDAWGNYRFTSELETSHNRFGFTGHYWDKEASLYYAKARYYDPFTARFTQADSFFGTIDDPPSLHRYFYAADNPTRYVDPDGHAFGEATAIGAGLGAVWGLGQAINSLWHDTLKGDYRRGFSDYAAIVAQNAVGGAELGLAVDAAPYLAPLAALGTPGRAAAGGILGGLAGAGIDALTFDGSAATGSDFRRGQLVGGASGAVVGAGLAVLPEVSVGLAIYGVGNGIQTIREGNAASTAVGAIEVAGSLLPFASRSVREASLGRISSFAREELLPRLNPFNYELARPSATASTFGAGQFPKYVGPNSGAGGISRLERPGFVEFEGLEVRGVRDLSHVPESTLRAMEEQGFAARDATGKKLILHHLDQNPAGPLVEMPGSSHSIGNRIQHPLGNASGAGLSAEQRQAFDAWRENYWSARAAEELARRGLK